MEGPRAPGLHVLLGEAPSSAPKVHRASGSGVTRTGPAPSGQEPGPLHPSFPNQLEAQWRQSSRPHADSPPRPDPWTVLGRPVGDTEGSLKQSAHPQEPETLRIPPLGAFPLWGLPWDPPSSSERPLHGEDTVPCPREPHPHRWGLPARVAGSSRCPSPVLSAPVTSAVTFTSTAGSGQGDPPWPGSEQTGVPGQRRQI